MRKERTPEEMLKDCLEVIREDVEVVGGCDHGAGVCICHLYLLGEEIYTYLKKRGMVDKVETSKLMTTEEPLFPRQSS